ncbi:hypothetical protein BP00DRAFT_53449 [Aspergillus indologenus CBS 114.80]|uniref:Uncharacterized protein n=1 Tax=Aspergillus indologenus CBS 114.80 TaxID=1450541 RepID=A0A2V5HWY1_9EURO|nr:hypothetical protein BP00DRAFT_53449 [Aspergillus indologenus CBS 114.80]
MTDVPTLLSTSIRPQSSRSHGCPPGNHLLASPALTRSQSTRLQCHQHTGSEHGDEATHFTQRNLKLSPASFSNKSARLAQSAERETLNLKVAGSTPALGFTFWSIPSFSTISFISLFLSPETPQAWHDSAGG